MADDRKKECNSKPRPKKFKNKVGKAKFHKQSYELITLYTNTNVVATYSENKYETVHHRTDNQCGDTKNDSRTVDKKKNKKKSNNLVKYKVFKYNKQKLLDYVYSSKNSHDGYQHYSLPDLQSQDNNKAKFKVRGSDIIRQKSYHPFHQKYIVNVTSEYNVPERKNLYRNCTITEARWKIYRCQFEEREESCCCSCNSDVMFEVMKSLYECYKKKNCDHCDCILCGHLPKEERRMGEMRKSDTASKKISILCGHLPKEERRILRGHLPKEEKPILCGHLPKEERRMGEMRESETASKKIRTKELERKAKEAIATMEGISSTAKKKMLKDLAMAGTALPEGKTASEKDLIKKLRAQLGLPPEPTTAAEREKQKKAEAAGIIFPLEGKSHAGKERLLKKRAEMGLELPEGRTFSEKSLIKKVKVEILSEKLRKPKAACLLTPLGGKTPEQKSGRTLSDKFLTAMIKASPPGISTPSIRASERLQKAKAPGLMIPLKGKTPEHKEKVLRGLAMHGLPLPEGKTSSKKKLVNKVRNDVGLPPLPKTAAERKKYDKALAAGIITPLEGKSPANKEKILRAQQALGLPLPEGRTCSEKSLIAKVKTSPTLPFPSGISISVDTLKKAKAAGIFTPLEGRSSSEKERILRAMAMNRIPLPVGRTASEKKLFNKVRNDVVLPPEPKTAADKAKYNKGLVDGIVTPLEAKTSARKEKVLRAQHNAGIPLHKGRTPSGKSLIARIKAGPLRVSTPSVRASERFQEAKAAELLTPLACKTPEQKEKVLRGLAMHGLPLPEGKTKSGKKLADKVRKDVGLPPEPRTAAERKKYDKALAAGIVTPLEGKSPPKKEKILRAQQALGLPLPKGRTASEKSLIAKVKASPVLPFHSGISIPVDKLRKAKAAGILTPMEGKSPSEKERILRAMAINGIPLPVGRTASKKKLIDKVRNDVGLPPEPKTAAEKEKYNKGMAGGFVTPLGGKTPAQKERVLRAQHNAGIPMPVGRTPSEKSLIARIKAGPPSVSSPSIRASERLRKAKAAGLLTPLGGSTPEYMDKFLSACMHGLPLPEGKTTSEKKLDKVRNDVGLPPEPKTAAERHKYVIASAADLVTPLELKSPAKKEKILRAQQALGLPLPEGRTASEKSLIAKVKASPTLPTPCGISIPVDTLKKANAGGILTLMEEKNPAEKERILRAMAMNGIPLPVGRTASEKKLINKVCYDVGLPPEPKTAAEKEKYDRGMLTIPPIVTPLEGKTPARKEKVLRAQHETGIPLPVGRTPSEKSLIARIKVGILTPLGGKTSKQKEKVLRGMAIAGIPLPEGKTTSEKKLINKVRKGVGLPPEPKTAAEKDKYNKAFAAGIISPLEDKTPKQKEKILTAQYDAGIPLPEGRTPSEKSLIDNIKEYPRAISSEKLRKAIAAGLPTPLKGKTPKEKEIIVRGLAEAGLPLPGAKSASEKSLVRKVRAEYGIPPEARTPSEKVIVRKTRADGLLTPLQGKTPFEKENIVIGLAEAGLPIPEGTTPSDKALVKKVRDKMGLPAEPTPSEKKGKIRPRHKKPEFGVAPEAVTPSEKEIVKRAKPKGLITPLTGKTPEQKENIVRRLAAAGLPIPEGKASSEKALVKKIRANLGLPPKLTLSEKKGKIRQKSKRLGTAAMKKSALGIGIEEEFQDFIKTTTCDRGCGCVKKKIKFKHSYVKIRVTSPDISSFYSCPGECVPRVKHGVFIVNKGIKVTVGSAVGTPTYSKEPQLGNITLHYRYCDKMDATYNEKKHNLSVNKTNKEARDPSVDKTLKYLFDNKSYFTNSSDGDLSSSIVVHNDYDILHEKEINKIISSQSFVASSFKVAKNTKPKGDSSISYLYDIPKLLSFYSTATVTTSKSSLESILLIKTEPSVSLPSVSSIEDATINIISIAGSIFSFNASYNLISDSNMDCNSKFFTTRLTTDSLTSLSKEIVEQSEGKITKSFDEGVLIFRLNQTEFSKNGNSRSCTQLPNDEAPIIVISDLCCGHNIMDVVNNILSKTTVSENSSIFILVPTDESDIESSYDGTDSTICIQVSQSICKWKKQDFCNNEFTQPTTSTGMSTRKRRCTKHLDTESKSGNDIVRSAPRKSLTFETKVNEAEFSVKNTFVTLKPSKRNQDVGVDTMLDRPCCCPPKEQRAADVTISNCSTVMSEILTPMIAEQSIAQGFNEQGYEYHSSRNIRTQKSILDTKDIYACSRQSPLKLSVCKIPLRKDPKCPMSTQVSILPSSQDTDCCHCTPDKFKEVISQIIEEQMTSTGCGGTSSPAVSKQPIRPPPPPRAEVQDQEMNTETPTTPTKIQKIKKISSGTSPAAAPPDYFIPCEYLKPIRPEDGKQICDPSLVDGKAQFSCQGKPKGEGTCACEMYFNNSFKKIQSDKKWKSTKKDKTKKESKPKVEKVKSCNCCICAGGEAIKGKKCKCPKRSCITKKMKQDNPEPGMSEAKRCDCASEPAELKFDMNILQEMIEEHRQTKTKEDFKMISDMSQTTSGFQMKYRKKIPNMLISLEEAIKYYEMHPEDIPESTMRRDAGCVCADKTQPKKSKTGKGKFSMFKKKKVVDCAGPVHESVAEKSGKTGECIPAACSHPLAGSSLEGIPLDVPRGFKIFVGGKGSGAKIHSGVFCFDMLHEQTNFRSSTATSDVSE